jgi:hypothetical protein
MALLLEDLCALSRFGVIDAKNQDKKKPPEGGFYAV